MSATGDDKTPAPPADAGGKTPPDAQPGPTIAPPDTPEADHGAGGDPLIEGP